jgi:N-terminal domain of anti-restriction factor ArdC
MFFSRITTEIVEYLEKGVRPWTRPWNAEHADGRITRPLRFNGHPYSGINVLSLWMSALSQNFAAPIWMTFRFQSETSRTQSVTGRFVLSSSPPGAAQAAPKVHRFRSRLSANYAPLSSRLRPRRSSFWRMVPRTDSMTRPSRQGR